MRYRNFIKVRGYFYKGLLFIFSALEEIVADKSYHSNQTLVDFDAVDIPALTAGMFMIAYLLACPRFRQELIVASKITLLAVGVGLAAGWAVRSLADSPQGAGVKLLEIALDAKERVGRWVAVEAERLEDMLAEARLKAEPDIPRPNKANNGSGDKDRSGNERANPRRRSPRPVEPEERA